MESAIYVGTLRHQRFRPVRHEFTYPLFMPFLDIDCLPHLMNVSPLASYNRKNWISFQERDHFGDPAVSLRERLARNAQERGIALPAGQIFLLTHLRYLGYNFNPVSFFYFFAQDELQMLMAEVSNTFGETENYWLNSRCEQSAANSKKYRFSKAFHVSPFMGMRQEYEWTFTPPSDRLISECLTYEGQRPIFSSTLTLNRRDWSRRELHRVVARFPWVTLKVIAAIHWQALRLMAKGVPVVSHPGSNCFTKSPTQHWGASWRPD